MPQESFQNEMPPARINIFYEKDIGDAKKKVELPQRSLIVTDFTLKEDPTPIEDLEKIPIKKDNFNQVMEGMELSINFNVPNKLVDDPKAEIDVNLEFKNINDFHPDKVVTQIEELNKLLKVRGLLKDLKAKVVNNRQFREQLNTIISDGKASNLIKEIEKIGTEEVEKNVN